MKIFFLFLCFVIIRSHAVFAGKVAPSPVVAVPLLINELLKHENHCCTIYDHRCCCDMYHGGLGKFHSWSSDFRNGNCVNKRNCDYGWKC
jgi:hypothetical protein